MQGVVGMAWRGLLQRAFRALQLACVRACVRLRGGFEVRSKWAGHVSFPEHGSSGGLHIQDRTGPGSFLEIDRGRIVGWGLLGRRWRETTETDTAYLNHTIRRRRFGHNPTRVCLRSCLRQHSPNRHERMEQVQPVRVVEGCVMDAAYVVEVGQDDKLTLCRTACFIDLGEGSLTV